MSDKVDKFMYVRLTKIDKNVYVNHFRYNIYLDRFFVIKKIFMLTILWLTYLFITLKRLKKEGVGTTMKRTR